MSVTVQRRLFLAGGVLLGLVLLLGVSGLPDVGVYRGPYGDVLVQVNPQERNTANAVTATVFDARALDTLGEEFILLTAVLGVAVLLRVERREHTRPAPAESESRQAPDRSPAVRVLGLALVGPLVLLGLYTVVYGTLTPGGGFQGGLVLATAALLVFLADGYETMRAVRPDALVDLAEATGAGGFVMVGLAGLVTAGAFLANILPLGTLGSIASGGIMPVLNLAVGLEVAGAFVLLLSELLRQTLERHGPDGGRPT